MGKFFAVFGITFVVCGVPARAADAPMTPSRGTSAAQKEKQRQFQKLEKQLGM